MKSKFPVLHSFLFAVYPIVELLYKLSPSDPLSAAGRSLAMVLSLTGLCLLLFYRLERNWERAALITTLTLLAFFLYGQLYFTAWNWHIGPVRIGRHEILFPLWLLALGLLGSRWTWCRVRSPQIFTIFLNVTIVATLLFSTGRYVFSRSLRAQATLGTPPLVGLKHAETLEVNATQFPDVYYIIPDSYASADVLQQLYGFDNTDFLTALQARGFYIATSSRSNYAQTALSVASSLNFDFLTAQPADTPDRNALIRLLKHSRLRTTLTDLGYQWVVVESGYYVTEMRDADIYYHSERPLAVNDLEGLLLIGSAAIIAMDKGWLSIPVAGRANAAQVQYALEKLPEIATLPGPKFVFFHIISPHPPFVLDRHGRFVSPLSPFMGSIDGNARSGSPKIYIPGYTEKLLYTNAMLLNAIDAILAQSEVSPIIIIQGDHGPGLFWTLESAEDTCLQERFSILNAYHLPGEGAQALYPEITPVNTFRVILDTYWGTQLGLLEDRSYFSTWQQPYAFEDVSEQLKNPCVVRE